MLRMLYLPSNGQLQTDLSLEQLSVILDQMDGLLWLDIAGEPVEECERILCNIFHFHPLAVADALQEIHVPKVDDWDSYVYLVLHSVSIQNIEDDEVESQELDIFIGKHFIVTYREETIHEVEDIWNACLRDDRFMRRGSAFILYRLADELVDGYMQVIDQVEDIIEAIEDQIFKAPSSGILERIFTLKRTLLHLRRIITPQRDVLNNLARSDYEPIEGMYKVFYRDVYDHLVRLTDVNDGMRELVSEALNSYLSVVNNHLNDVMKALTIITTLFMPISFLTGFFGMNFFQPVLDLQSWTGAVAFIAVLIAMLAIPTSMYLWIKKQHWM